MVINNAQHVYLYMDYFDHDLQRGGHIREGEDKRRKLRR
jgi:hypothetical protein